MITNVDVDVDKNNSGQAKIRLFATIMPINLKLILSFQASNLVCKLKYLIFS